MKKLFACLLVFILAFSALPVVLAEEVESEEPGTQFEKVLLKKGSLIIKEFIDCCLFEEDENYKADYLKAFSDTLQFQSASITDVETGDKVYALRVIGYYYRSDYDNGEAVGVMDADEIDGAISTLEYIQAHKGEMKNYSEIEYSSNSGMSIGAYYDGGYQLFVKINSKATKFYRIDKIDGLISALNQVKDTFEG